MGGAVNKDRTEHGSERNSVFKVASAVKISEAYKIQEWYNEFG